MVIMSTEIDNSMNEDHNIFREERDLNIIPSVLDRVLPFFSLSAGKKLERILLMLAS
jgi:hypothetical protein